MAENENSTLATAPDGRRQRTNFAGDSFIVYPASATRLGCFFPHADQGFSITMPGQLSQPLLLPFTPTIDADAPICGVDEAGRGCLAGPVVAAAIVFPVDFDFALLPGLTDSKKLTEKKRLALEPAIRAHALAFALGLATAREIDTVNILNATLRAMSRAVRGVRHRLGLPPALLIDGNKTIAESHWRAALPGAPALPRQKAVVGGDALIPAISAASILAKNLRDRLLTAAAAQFPGYGFAEHKGYGTADHLRALAVLGPCPLHRRTFAKVDGREQHRGAQALSLPS